MNTVSVQIVVDDVNGKSADYKLTIPMQVGQHIPTTINVAAAEAAAKAAFAMELDISSPIEVDRS